LSDGRQEKPTISRPQELPLQREQSAHELPEAVKNLIDARTGDAVYVVDPDYRIVHWDSRMESLTGTLAEDALGQPCYFATPREPTTRLRWPTG
jgi:PAS domain-containing protein